MRLLTTLVLFSLSPLAGQTSDEKDAVAIVQKVFDGMKAHDADLIRAALLPDARFYSVRESGAVAGTNGADFITQIVAIKSDLLERFTAQPRVLIRGRMAQVWGEYEFLRDGKFNHCGVDSASLLKTADGWKIAAIVYTSETTGCQAH
jgi:hypothetical protein